MKIGNAIQTITTLTGIKYLVGDCAKCEERRILLNEMFSKSKSVNLLNKEQIEHLESIRNKTVFKTFEVDKVVLIYESVFEEKPRLCFTCSSSGFKEVLNKLYKVLNNQVYEGRKTKKV